MFESEVNDEIYWEKLLSQLVTTVCVSSCLWRWLFRGSFFKKMVELQHSPKLRKSGC